jgi:large subunit ribosomal protein L6
MSRIGKQPIKLGKDVSASLHEGVLAVKGKKGTLTWKIPYGVNVLLEEDVVSVNPIAARKNNALWGTTRAIIANMVRGVSEGYEKKLELEGVGYRASVSGTKLVLSVGFSHPIEIVPPEGVSFTVEKNVITVSGIDKVMVGEIAARVRAAKKPEPYKGKGIHYQGEVVRRKAGKKAAGATTA